VIHLSSIPQESTNKMTKIKKAETLNACGFSSKTPSGVLFGHHRLEIMDVAIEQGARNLIKFANCLLPNPKYQ
jgi:hypothetical protein